MGAETGRKMAEWAKGEGDAQAQKETLDLARAKAKQGKDAFATWWNSDEGKLARPVARTIMDELQTIASQAERDTVHNDDDPFAGSAESSDDQPADSMTPEQRAEYEAAIAGMRESA